MIGKLKLLVVGIAVAALVGTFMLSVPRPSDAQEAADSVPTERTLTVADHEQIQGIRSDLALSLPELTLLGVDEARATQVLEAVYVWQQARGKQLAQARRDVVAAQARLRSAQRAVAAGEDTAAPASSVDDALAGLQDSRRAVSGLLDELDAHVTTLLTPPQRQRRAALRLEDLRPGSAGAELAESLAAALSGERPGEPTGGAGVAALREQMAQRAGGVRAAELTTLSNRPSAEATR